MLSKTRMHGSPPARGRREGLLSVLGMFGSAACCALAGRLTSLMSLREVSKRRRPRLRRSARCADYPAVLESAGGRRKLAALRQSTAESPARSCAHRRRNGDGGYGGEIASRFPKNKAPEVTQPKSTTLQSSSYRRKPVSSALGHEAPFEKRHWTPAFAGVTGE